MRLALFDLDHTLIPFDSGMAWTRFLVERRALPPEADAEYLAWCHQYVAGTLDIRAMHRACMAPLAAFEPACVQAWLRGFESEIAARVPAAMRDRVARHRAAGDLCAIVTATARLIAEPLARVFAIADVVATEGVLRDGRPTGEIDGEPCYREHKVARVEQWLARRGSSLAAHERSWFYSDSASDLPLLLAVTDPVAVHPDPALRAHAQRSGWPILERLHEGA
jgi:HAD superfamily hydrolase (TIGR01490 family)